MNHPDEWETVLPEGVPPAEPAFAQDGVDLTLIRWMLSLTPEERLRVLQDRESALEAVRAASSGCTSEPS